MRKKTKLLISHKNKIDWNQNPTTYYCWLSTLDDDMTLTSLSMKECDITCNKRVRFADKKRGKKKKTRIGPLCRHWTVNLLYVVSSQIVTLELRFSWLIVN